MFILDDLFLLHRSYARLTSDKVLFAILSGHMIEAFIDTSFDKGVYGIFIMSKCRWLSTF